MRERFEELLAAARAAFVEGRFSESEALLQEAEELATDHGETDLADQAFCSRCWLHIEQETAEPLLPRLKRILLSSGSLRNRWLAAHHTAVAQDIAGETERAHSYAERAREIAAKLEDRELIARSANLTGTLAMRSSSFEEAESCYRQALSLHSGENGVQRIMEAQEKDNLGYVLMCTDRLQEGITLCEEARAQLEAIGAEGVSDYLHQTLQDLCYGYLLDDQLDRAEACGERALDLALANDDPLVVKNCLFLLGETAVRRGDAFRARRRLRELASYFPEVAVSDEVVDLLLATDMTSVVNLRG
jgi:tetratricopeptide (TPR) repeat protein